MTGVRAFFRAHATGATIVLFAALAVTLSVSPLPDWARPLDVLRDPDPLRAIATVALRGGSPVSAAAEAPAGESGDAEEPVKEEVVPTAPATRKAWVEPDRSKYHRVRGEVGAAPQPIVNPCVDGSEDNCKRRALDRFFTTLSEIEDGGDNVVARVIHFGDSLIASDHITDMVRLRLHERFGSGGRGFLMVDRLSRFAGRRVRTGFASKNWERHTITDGSPPDNYFGYTGASFTATAEGETSVFDVGPNRLAEVFYLRQKGGGQLELYADANLIRTVDTNGEPLSAVESVTLPEGTKSLKLRARTKNVRVFGVSLEAGVSGVVYESLGLPGATSKVWLLPDISGFKDNVLRRDPALFVTMLGGNDGLMLSKKRTTAEEIAEATNTFVGRLRATAPDADCLIVSPMDSARTSVSGEMISKPEVPIIIEIQKKVAAEHGCAFWDMWTSMGGTGALGRWFNKGMINGDMIHPKGYGGDLLGELMVTALMQAYDEFTGGGAIAVRQQEKPVKKPSEPPVEKPAPAEDAAKPIEIEPIAVRPEEPQAAPAEPPPPPKNRGPLEPFFDKLAQLEREKSGRVAIAMLGSSHVARHYFTDEVRSRLGARFGSRGRGYASAGRGAKVFDDAGIKRALTGRFTMYDGKDESEETALVGMSGIRTELKRGAKFVYAPCPSCTRRDPSIFELFYLVRPGMGAAEIEVTGAPRARIGRSGAAEPELAWRKLSTRSARPQLRVTGRGSAGVDIFGVVHEIDRPGIVVDPIAYPGVTPEVALRWDQNIVLGMLAKRRPDLLVLFYGETESELQSIDEAAYRRDFSRLVRRLREGTDDVACLVLGALPVLGAEGTDVAAGPVMTAVKRVQKDVAAAEGCAYWAGETLVSDAVYDPNGDRRDVTNDGLKSLGERFASELTGQFDRWLEQQERGDRAAVRTQ